jgi:hypothetical protein
MSSELFSVFAETSNTAYVLSATALTSGAMLLGSSLWSGYATSIRIPKGCALKVWESKVQTNTPAQVQIQATMSGTGTVYKVLDTDSVDTSGGEVRTSRSGRPLVVESHDGQRAVRFYFITPAATTTSAMVYGSYNIEITELGVD